MYSVGVILDVPVEVSFGLTKSLGFVYGTEDLSEFLTWGCAGEYCREVIHAEFDYCEVVALVLTNIDVSSRNCLYPSRFKWIYSCLVYIWADVWIPHMFPRNGQFVAAFSYLLGNYSDFNTRT